MRRIIKRTVTIVTTITWTISWRPKGSTPLNVELQITAPEPPILSEGEPGLQEVEATLTKEVEVSETITTSDLMADLPPDNIYYQNSERKGSNS
jgi:hypothetical protein